MIALTVDIFDKGGRVLVRHIFYGETEAEAEKWRSHHMESCEYFQAAEEEGRTGEFYQEIEDEEAPSEADYEEDEDEEYEEQ